ncbi:MAG: rhodanese-like domain-containing protein [Fimbriimonadaceae bacterium]
MKISVDQLKEKISSKKPSLIDVRSVSEFNAGHIPGAINIPIEHLTARLEDLPLNEVVLVCHSGNRASTACEMLTVHHPELTVLDGGTQAWIEKGEKVIATGSSTWSIERQVRFAAGFLVGLGILLGFTVAPGWFGLSAFVSVGLMFAAITNFCGMAILISKLPWNQPATCDSKTKALEGGN